MSKLLKLFGVLWGTSQVDSNSIDTSGYAFKDTITHVKVLSLFLLLVFVNNFRFSEIMIVCCSAACQVDGAED